METSDTRNLFERAADDCCRSSKDWNTMYSGDQEALIDAWIRGYKTSESEKTTWLENMAKEVAGVDGIDGLQVRIFIDWVQKRV